MTKTTKNETRLKWKWNLLQKLKKEWNMKNRLFWRSSHRQDCDLLIFIFSLRQEVSWIWGSQRGLLLQLQASFYQFEVLPSPLLLPQWNPLDQQWPWPVPPCWQLPSVPSLLPSWQSWPNPMGVETWCDVSESWWGFGQLKFLTTDNFRVSWVCFALANAMGHPSGRIADPHSQIKLPKSSF